MTARPRHPDKTLERLLRDAENQGWKVVKGKVLQGILSLPRTLQGNHPSDTFELELRT